MSQKGFQQYRFHLSARLLSIVVGSGNLVLEKRTQVYRVRRILFWDNNLELSINHITPEVHLQYTEVLYTKLSEYPLRSNLHRGLRVHI